MTATAGPARLLDVARIAGVSLATASKALNDRSGVSASTRTRVLDVAASLGFEANPLARNLAVARSRTVGLLVRDSRVHRFAVPVMLGAENALGDTELSVLLCDGRGDEIRVRNHLRTLAHRRVDGIIVIGADTEMRQSLSASASVPIAYAYSGSDDPRDMSFVPDNAAGARAVVDHLVAGGRRRIAHVTGPAHLRATSERAAGVLEALAAAGLPLAGAVAHGEWTQQWGRHATAMLLAGGVEFDAVVCGSDQIATGVADALVDHGVSVPGEVALTGFDNWDVFTEQARPPLTSVDMELEALGAAAARALLRAVDGEPTPGVHPQPCRLVVRESSAPRVVRPRRRRPVTGGPVPS